ncbi:hypothetical protein F5Y09DRAFT_356136 [Xylaria sp. FL1042]|nr:hypothetical protein F5Y09DRAFT_356136 [Xylaria sp. FL1042]
MPRHKHSKNPNVKTLEVIADNWWNDPTLVSRESSRTKTPHDPLALTQLVATRSSVVQDPHGEAVKKFMEWLRHGQKMDLESMSASDILHELKKGMIYIDNLFFFSLLSRKVKLQTEVSRLVRLEFTDGTPAMRANGDYLRARYSKDDESPFIEIWRYDALGNPYSFGIFVYILMHEMCHAFFSIFGDRRHPNCRQWIDDYQGHGEMFWVLHRFMMGKIEGYLEAEHIDPKLWREGMEEMDRSCHMVTGHDGKPDGWGTPERMLKGGIQDHDRSKH